MRIFLLNLTRLGDLLQTAPTISALAQKGKVELICLENFAAAASMLPNLHAVHTLPGSSLLALTKQNWQQAIQTLYKWKQALNPQKSDIIINLTPSIAARLLASSLKGEATIKGFTLDEHGFSQYSNDWAVYLQAASACRGSSPLNLMDIFARVAQVGTIQNFQLTIPKTTTIPTRIFQENLENLSDYSTNEISGYAAFQLGASSEIRRWKTSYFAALGDLLWQKKRLCPILVGTADEKPLAQKYKLASHAPVVDMCGKTNLHELAAVLNKCQFLVTNDTGTMHMAAGLQVPIFAIFLATAQPWDTGPYQEKSFCLEPDISCHPCNFSTQCEKNHICRQLITPQTLFHCISYHHFGENINLKTEKNVRIWESRSLDGFMNLISHTNHDRTDPVRWLRLQRQAYRQLLDNTPFSANPADIPQGEIGEAIRSRLEQSAALFTLFEQQLALTIKKPEKIILDKVMSNWKRIHACWQGDPYFSVLNYLWDCHSQQNSELPPLLVLTSRYRQLLQILLQLFSKTSL